jgi:biopolymer transport protein ExbD
MAKFVRKGKKTVGAINTASLPDIVFMLLFFFMTNTVMKEVDLKVDIRLPEATEATKLEKKDLVSFIYIGKPSAPFQKLYGTEPRIQLNDQFKTVEDIADFIAQQRDAMNEADQAKMLVSLKVHEDTKMKIVTDTKQALRRASALKINYSSIKTEELR